MDKGPLLRDAHRLIPLRLGDRLIQVFEDGQLATVQTAVALLRTVFEDHHVDPDHQSCLFFHGCTVAGAQNRSHDFAVSHRGDRVILSEFTFGQPGPWYVSLPLRTYAGQVARFAGAVLSAGMQDRPMPPWQRQYLAQQWTYLAELVALSERFLAADCQNHVTFCAEFQAKHGSLKRPLEVQILRAPEQSKPRQPISVLARVVFGPIKLNERIPVRLNRGDVVLATVNEFTPSGVLLTLEGVGSCGVRPGDLLYGLQTFYP